MVEYLRIMMRASHVRMYDSLAGLFLSRPWLVQARLDLAFPLPVALATGISPTRRPTAPVLRHHPGY